MLESFCPGFFLRTTARGHLVFICWTTSSTERPISDSYSLCMNFLRVGTNVAALQSCRVSRASVLAYSYRNSCETATASLKKQGSTSRGGHGPCANLRRVGIVAFLSDTCTYHQDQLGKPSCTCTHLPYSLRQIEMWQVRHHVTHH